MRSSHTLSRVSVAFDDPNLVSHGGLLTAGVLAQRIGLDALVAEHVRLPPTAAGHAGANVPAKVATVLAGMLADADSISDLDVLRAGGTQSLFDDLRAPSTVGTFLRGCTPGTVRQLDALSRAVRGRLWAAGAGPHQLGRELVVDVDSFIVPVYGPAKQGAAFGYTKVRGLHPLLATVLEPGGAPDVAHTRLRRGNAASARGAASFVAEALSRVRAGGASGPLVVRADAGFYNGAFVSTCRRRGAAFSVTARHDAKVGRALAAIPETAWVPIPYWDSHVDPDTGQLVDSAAQVAETRYTAFAGTRHEVTARLVVRRVRRLRPKVGQAELEMDVWRYHALLTDRDLALLDVESSHRGHAIVEQVIADLKASAVAHLPSGSFTANAAWLAFAALAHNLTRALGALAGHGMHVATTATLRKALLRLPGRLARSARRWTLHLPAGWPWHDPAARALRGALAVVQRT